MVDIIRYVDPLAPNDDGDGLTPQTARKFFTTLATGSSGTGNVVNRSLDRKIIRMRGGLCHGPKTANLWTGSVSGWNVVFEPYWLPGDEQTNPLIDGLTWLDEDAGGWTLEGTADKGGYFWSRQLGTSQTVRRVWTNAKNTGLKRSERTLGDALRRTANKTQDGFTLTADNLASIKATLSSTEQWYGAGSTLTYKLYMWTPGGTEADNPSKYYKGLAIAQAGAGTFGFGFGFGFFNSRDFHVRNIDVRGAATTTFAIAVTDTDAICQNITFYRCQALGTFSGFRITQIATAAYLTAIENVEVRECHVDPLTSALEQEPNEAFSLISSADQCDIRGKVKKVSFIDCSGRNPGHAGVNLGSWDSAGAKPIQTGYLRHRVECDDWASYSRSIGMSLCEPSCYIIGCTFKGTNVVAQLAGSGAVVGNKFIGLRKGIRKISDAFNSFDGWFNIAIYRADGLNANVGNDKYWDMKPEGLLVAHNSCDGCYGTPIDLIYFKENNATALNAKAQTPLADNSLMVYNNLFIDSVAERAGKPMVVVASAAGAPDMGVQTFRRNAFYSAIGQPVTVRYKGTPYTDINSVPGFQGNMTQNPRVGSDLKPRPDSPLIAAGQYVGAVADYRGKRFGRQPTIGAYEVDAPVRRKKRTAAA